MPFLLQGLLVSFSIAASVGAIGALCIQRTPANPLTILSYGTVLAGLGIGVSTRS